MLEDLPVVVSEFLHSKDTSIYKRAREEMQRLSVKHVRTVEVGDENGYSEMTSAGFCEDCQRLIRPLIVNKVVEVFIVCKVGNDGVRSHLSSFLLYLCTIAVITPDCAEEIRGDS